ncbi:MAG: amidohydrolase family protein [Pigmentiphaga sp.]
MTSLSIISNVTLVTMDAARRIIVDAGLVWSGARILAVGKADDLAMRYPAARRFDGGGGLVCPGFIDAHNHSAHFLTKGLLDDVPLEQRWRTRLYPFECAVSEEESYWGAMGTFGEQLLHGTTCIGDPGSAHPGAAARAASDAGIRAVISGMITDTFDPSRPLDDTVEYSVTGMAAYSERLFDELDGMGDGRVKVAYGLWTGSTVSDELCTRILDLCLRRGATLHAHLATREADNDDALRRFGVRAVERYRRLGVLGPHFLGAHAGAIDDDEAQQIAASGASIVHCPSASMMGGFGCIAHGRFPELAAAGVNLALGSDAASISRFLDMPRLMYLAACAHKDVRRDSSLMGAHVAFEMATLGGARALGLQDTVGSLEPGKQADFVLLQTNGIEWQPRPWLNPVANLVYSSGGYRVDTVFVAGKAVVAEGQLQDAAWPGRFERIRAAATTANQRAHLPLEQVWPIH